MSKYHDVTAKLEQALSGLSYDTLDISDEVKEQVEDCLVLFLFWSFVNPEKLIFYPCHFICILLY